MAKNELLAAVIRYVEAVEAHDHEEKFRATEELQNLVEARAVQKGDACPKCGERDIGALAWMDDDTVRCHACGHEYQPGKIAAEGR